MINVIIGNKTYTYKTRQTAKREWNKFAKIFAMNGLNELLYFARTVFERINNGEEHIEYTNGAIKPLVSFWNDTRPVNVEWLGHLFQYENAREAFLAIREIEKTTKTSEGFDHLIAVSHIRSSILKGKTDIRITKDENGKYISFVDGELQELWP